MSQIAEPRKWDFSTGALPYRDQLFKSALRMTRSVEDAEDLLQETYLKAFKYYERFSEGTNFKAWIFKILTNRAKTRGARDKRMVASPLEDASGERDPVVDPARFDGYLAQIVRKRSRTVLSSGGLEPVLDSGGKGSHSVFASAFIDALTENDGIVDATRIFTKIRRTVMLNSQQIPEYADIRYAGHDGGDFLFVPLASIDDP